jgi:hypothetical protein
MSTEKGKGKLRGWVVIILVLMGGIGIGNVLATAPTADGVWDTEWIREGYAYFTHALTLPFTTAGRVLLAGPGDNVTDDAGFTYDTATNVATITGGATSTGWFNSTNGSYSNLYANSSQTTLWANTTDFKFTDDFYYGANNRTDIFAYPQLGPSYIFWSDGTTIYAKATATGVVTSSTSAYTAIQGKINAIQATGGSLFFKSGTYPLGTTTIELYSHGMSIIGESVTGTVFTYSGTAEAFKVRSSSARYYPALSGFTVQAIGGAVTSATAKGVVIENMSDASVERIKIMDFTAGNALMVNSGNGITSTLYGNYKSIWIYNCKYGLTLTGYSGFEVNCNLFEDIHIQCGTIAGSIGLNINRYCTKNQFNTFDISDAVNATVVDGQYNLFVNGRSEDISGTHIWTGANSVSNKFDFYLSVGAGTQKTDDGTTNIFENLLP